MDTKDPTDRKEVGLGKVKRVRKDASIKKASVKQFSWLEMQEKGFIKGRYDPSFKRNEKKMILDV